MHLLKKVTLAVVLLLSLAFVTHEASANYTPVATGTINITSGTLNVRDGKLSSSTVLFSLAKNTKVNILNRDGQFYKIYHNNKVGYVSVNYIKPTYIVQNATGFGFINTAVNFRGLPETLSTAQGIFYPNTKVFITGTVGTWYRINHNGGSYFIPKASVSANPKYTAINKTGTVKAKTTIYKATNLNGSVVSAIYKGESIKITGYYGDWYRVNYYGSVGYMLKSYVDVHATIKSVTVNNFVFVREKIKLYVAPSTSANYITRGGFDFDIAKTTSDNKWIVITDPNKVLSDKNATYYILKSSVTPKPILGNNGEVKNSGIFSYEHKIYLDSKQTAILRRLYEKELVLAITGKAIDSLSEAAYKAAINDMVKMDLDTLKKHLTKRGLGNIPVIGAFETLISFAASPKKFVEGYLMYPQAVIYYFLVRNDEGKGIMLEFNRTGFAIGGKSQ